MKVFFSTPVRCGVPKDCGTH